MQFFNLIVVALVSFAAAAPNPATPETEEVNIEKRVSL
jgi:hypothetical protein